MLALRKYSLPLALMAVAVLGVSGCQALDTLGGGQAEDESVSDGAATDSTTGQETPAPQGDAPSEEAPAEVAVPVCEDLYSENMNTALLDEVRVSVGDNSEGDFGYGTTNPALVSLLKTVRADLRISCTWYLPASESVSVTSVAIISGDTKREVSGVLNSTTAIASTLGAGNLWDIRSATSDESPDYIATEAHLLIDTPCPATLAEQSCALWVTSNYAYGQAKPLTVDAATTLGVLSAP